MKSVEVIGILKSKQWGSVSVGRVVITRVIVLLTLAGVVGACSSKQVAEEQSPFYKRGDSLFLQPAAKQLLERVEFGVATAEQVGVEHRAAGRIEAIPTELSHIALPLAGRITKSYVAVGQQVKQHAPLFEVASPEFASMQKAYFQAEAAKALAQSNWLRKEELLQKGVESARGYEEALNELRQADRELENDAEQLRAFHVEPTSMKLGDPLVVYSPLAGTIIESQIVVGQYLQSDAPPVAVVANLSSLWVSAQVKESEIGSIHLGDSMRISVDALPHLVQQGRVTYIANQVDPETRAVWVVSLCSNPNELLKLGMYATVEFQGTPREYIVLSESALLQGEKESYVWVKASSNLLLKRAVKCHFTQEGRAYLTGDVEVGDSVVNKGGYYFQ